ncbi:potassium channel subfamily K member 4-like [Ptychodera flava]|uniref:potassium channel subfamily K member 4-like n=1 Tax=Ptychodera flava TaxID=63121 RepID=UPI003969EB8D
MHWVSMLILSFSFLVYLLIGAAVFMALESDNEETARVDMRRFKEIWLTNYSCVDQQAMESLITAVVTAINNGVSPGYNSTSPSNWDYSSSFFFAGTVVTTIGYGNISPSTYGGQAFCIVFAFIGIPLCGIFLSEIGNRLGERARRLEDRVSKWKCLATHPKTARVLYLLLLVSLGTLFFITFPSFIIAAVEKWSYSESWYYASITLFTIGFGDYVMGTNEDIRYHVIYKWAGYAWIIIGLAYMALLVDMVSNIMKKWGTNIGEETEKDASANTTKDEIKPAETEMDDIPMIVDSYQNGAKQNSDKIQNQSVELISVTPSQNDQFTEAEMHGFRTAILGLSMFIYLFLGAAVFQALESTNGSSSAQSDVGRLGGDQLDQLSRVNFSQLKKQWDNYTCLDDDAIDRLIIDVLTAVNVSASPRSDETSPPDWDYDSAFFFALTVVTTIGYGNITPSTRAGRTFCVFYAFVGIPLCGLVLKAIGDRLGNRARRFEKFVTESKCFARYPRLARLVFLSGVVLFGTIVFITLPSIVISTVEGWTYPESWYYCFVTLLTIGFGDFVMANNEDISYPSLYKVVGYVWIIVGLAYLALVINMIGDILQKWDQKTGSDVDFTSAPVRTPDGQDNGALKLENPGVVITNVE